MKKKVFSIVSSALLLISTAFLVFIFTLINDSFVFSITGVIMVTAVSAALTLTSVGMLQFCYPQKKSIIIRIAFIYLAALYALLLIGLLFVNANTKVFHSDTQFLSISEYFHAFVKLIPFSAIIEWLRMGRYQNILLNVLLMLPLGALLSIAPINKKSRVLIACALPILITVLQAVLRCSLISTDQLLLRIIGSLIGYFVAAGFFSQFNFASDNTQSQCS